MEEETDLSDKLFTDKIGAKAINIGKVSINWYMETVQSKMLTTTRL